MGTRLAGGCPPLGGTAIGAIATGQVHAPGTGNRAAIWTGSTPLLTGALFTGTCAWLAAAYLTVDTRRAGQPDLVSYFSRRARAAGIVTGFLAAGTLADLHFTAPQIFTRLTMGPGLPLVVISAAAVTVVFVVLSLDITRAIRPLAAAAVTAVIWGWGIDEYPYLLPRSLTVQAGSAPAASLWSILVIFAVTAVLVGPGFLLLFTLRHRQKLSGEDERDVTEADIPGLQAADFAAAGAGPAETGIKPPVIHPGARALAMAVAFLTGVTLGCRQHQAHRGRRP